MENRELAFVLTETGVRVTSGTAYIAYICQGGSGFDIAVVTNGEWHEGADELLAVCATEVEANMAISAYIGE